MRVRSAANFSTFDAIARTLYFGPAARTALDGHGLIFGFMQRALQKARTEAAAHGSDGMLIPPRRGAPLTALIAPIALLMSCPVAAT